MVYSNSHWSICLSHLDPNWFPNWKKKSFRSLVKTKSNIKKKNEENLRQKTSWSYRTSSMLTRCIADWTCTVCTIRNCCGFSRILGSMIPLLLRSQVIECRIILSEKETVDVYTLRFGNEKSSTYTLWKAKMSSILENMKSFFSFICLEHSRRLSSWR